MNRARARPIHSMWSHWALHFGGAPHHFTFIWVAELPLTPVVGQRGSADYFCFGPHYLLRPGKKIVMCVIKSFYKIASNEFDSISALALPVASKWWDEGEAQNIFELDFTISRSCSGHED